MKNYIKIARPDHWIKNLFIVPGVILANLLTDSEFSPETGVRFVAGFSATCLTASANYVINEWLDARFDRYHPTKKNRPVVTGNMKFSLVMLEYVLLTAAGLLLSLPVSQYFLYAELWLLAMGILYNVEPFRTKDIAYLDVLSESVNNLIRLLLGWFIITSQYQPPLSIMTGYWMGGAFLMATKRFAEYRMIGDVERAGLYRKSFRRYTERSLLISAFFYALAAAFLIGIFMLKYRIEYLLAMPFLFGLFCFYLYIAFEPDSAVQKPEKLYREKKLFLYIIVMITVMVMMTYIRIPALDYFVETLLIGI